MMQSKNSLLCVELQVGQLSSHSIVALVQVFNIERGALYWERLLYLEGSTLYELT